MTSEDATGFTTREVAEALGIPTSEIRAWTKGGVLSPARDARGGHRYSFQDVALLREARTLLDGSLPARRVRATLRALRAQLPPGEPLSTLRMAVRSGRVLVQDAERVWEPDSGQIFFDFWMGDPPVTASGEDPSRGGATVIALAARTDRAAWADGRERVAVEAPATRGPSAEAWYEVALQLEASSPEDAEAAYRRALEVDPSHTDAHVNLGRILHERGHVADAEGHYREAMRADATSAAARYNLGVALEDQGRTGEAAEAYRAALARDDRLAAAHFNLARLCEARGEEAEALAHLVAYKRLTSSRPPTS